MSNDVVISKEELKPCPFCGGEAEYMNYGPEGQMIRCSECCAILDKDTKEQAIAAWNLRAAPETVSLEGVETYLKARREELVATVKRRSNGKRMFWSPSINKIGDEGVLIDKLLSDLRHLVAPVQPSLEINTSVFTTKAICDLRDVSWDLIYRLEEWVGGVESKQDEKIIDRAKQALSKLVKP